MQIFPLKVNQAKEMWLNRGKIVAGFTMIEMLVVMGIIAILAALIIPKVGNSITSLKMRSEMRTCAAVLRYARSIAITTRKEQKVSFQLKRNTDEKDCYSYSRVKREPVNQNEESGANDEEGAGGGKQEFNSTKKEQCMEVGFLNYRDNAEDDWQEEGNYEVIFTPRGFSTGGEIRFAIAEEQKGYILSVDPVTGRVDISREKE